MLDGNKIPMSDEKAESLRKEQKKWRPFDKTVGGIRISSFQSDRNAGSMRISIPRERYGFKTGFYNYHNEELCPGDILSIEYIKELRDTLTAAIEHHKEKP